MRTILSYGDGTSQGTVPHAAAEALHRRAPSAATFAAAADAPVVVIEKRSLIRECLAACIASLSGHRVISFPDLETCLAAAETPSASLLVLCDPGTLTRAELEQLSLLIGQLPVVVLSDGEDLEEILRAIRHGVRGYIPTSLTLPVMIEALRLVRAGGTFVPAQSIVSGLRPGSSDGLSEQAQKPVLTARQTEVVAAIGRGKANKEIALELNMSESTVKVHVRRIMKKLSATNRTKVALMADSLLSGAVKLSPGGQGVTSTMKESD
jgi:DNA-binding NarL/FixJ family response regulator